MKSRDLVLVLRLVSKPIFAIVSVSKAAGLETLNIENKWLSKTYIIQKVNKFLFTVFADKKQSKQTEQRQKFEKNQLRSDDGI